MNLNLYNDTRVCMAAFLDMLGRVEAVVKDNSKRIKKIEKYCKEKSSKKKTVRRKSR